MSLPPRRGTVKGAPGPRSAGNCRWTLALPPPFQSPGGLWALGRNWGAAHLHLVPLRGGWTKGRSTQIGMRPRGRGTAATRPPRWRGSTSPGRWGCYWRRPTQRRSRRRASRRPWRRRRASSPPSWWRRSGRRSRHGPASTPKQWALREQAASYAEAMDRMGKAAGEIRRVRAYEGELAFLENAGPVQLEAEQALALPALQALARKPAVRLPARGTEHQPFSPRTRWAARVPATGAGRAREADWTPRPRRWRCRRF